MNVTTCRRRRVFMVRQTFSIILIEIGIDWNGHVRHLISFLDFHSGVDRCIVILE